MATKDKDSWKKRRWKLFKQVYNNDETFRTELTKHFTEYETTRAEFYGFLTSHGIPIYCSLAIIYFVSVPDLKEQEYLDLILPPLTFWNASLPKVGPRSNNSPAKQLKDTFEILDEAGIGSLLGVDIKKINFRALSYFISNGSTIFHVTSFVKREELHELIDEYWDDIEPMLNYRFKPGDKFYSAKLLEAIYAPQTITNIERDKLIMSLSEAGASDEEIAGELSKANYGSFTYAYIRQIRYRMRHKKNK